jgi:acyl-CoA thioester hydrolase
VNFEAPADRVLVYEIDIPIRWGDMDAMGHVNNTVYFRYMEQARISWMEVLGHRGGDAEGMLVVNAHCTFVRQLEYPGTVRVRHYVGSIGRSSFELYDEMVRTDDPDTVYAHGGAKGVWCDYGAKKSKPLPDTVRAAMTRPLR